MVTNIKSLFDEVKTEILAKQHPLINADSSVKHAYLTGLAIIAATNAEDDFTKVEKEYLNGIAAGINLAEELYKNALTTAIKPDKSVVKTIVETIEQRYMQFLFLIDAYNLSKIDGNISETENHIINSFMKFFKFTNDETDNFKKIKLAIHSNEYEHFFYEINKIDNADEEIKDSILKYYFLKEYEEMCNKKKSELKKNNSVKENITSSPLIIIENNKPDINITQKNPDFEKIDIGDGIILEMVYIEPGSFSTGLEYNSDEIYNIKLTRGFWLGKYPLMEEQWELYRGNPYFFNSYGKNYPIANITWDNCQKFFVELNSKKLVDGRFRLPSEAEWEYACRAGSTTKYYWGDEFDEEYCWYKGNADSPRPVGLKLPNAWGLYDMCGNVWEFCNNAGYSNYPSGEIMVNPSGSYSNKKRFVRGGSYRSIAESCTSSFYKEVDDYDYADCYGFRVLLMPNN